MFTVLAKMVIRLRLILATREMKSKGGPKAKNALGAKPGKKKLFKKKVRGKRMGIKEKGTRQRQFEKINKGEKGWPKPNKKWGAGAKSQKGVVIRSSTGVPG